MRPSYTLLLAVAAAGFHCAGPGRDDVAVTQTGNPTKVSLVVRADTSAAGLLKGRLSSTVNAVTITRARLVVGDVEMETADDSVEFRRDAPYVIDLHLDGVPTVIDSLIIAPGVVFEAVEYTILPMPESLATASGQTDLAGLSMSIEGYVDGDTSQEFSFTSSLTERFDRVIDPPLTIRPGDSTHVLFLFSLNTWFTTSQGEMVDPRDAASVEVIEQNVSESVTAHEDPEGDGEIEND